MTPVFLLSPPRRDWTVRGRSNFKSQTAGDTPPGKALEEWSGLAEAIERAGGKVLVMPPPPHLALTGLPFTAEAGHFVVHEGHPTFLLPNVTPAHRRDEATFIAGFAEALGWRTIAIAAKWEGQGDAFRIDARKTIHTYGIGTSARTSREALDEIAPYFPGERLAVGFHADPWFHGNTFLAPFHSSRADETVLCVCPDALLAGERERLEAFVAGNTSTSASVVFLPRAQSLAYATNSLQVCRTVIAPRGVSPDLHALWRGRLGLEVVELDFEILFHQGGGAAVCLSNRLDGVRADAIPQHLTLTALKNRLQTSC